MLLVPGQHFLHQPFLPLDSSHPDTECVFSALGLVPHFPAWSKLFLPVHLDASLLPHAAPQTA